MGGRLPGTCASAHDELMMTEDPVAGATPLGHGSGLPPLVTAARGESAGGARWTISVGGTREDCLTLMEIEFADGRRGAGGGLGGPTLVLDRLTNMSWHWSDSGLTFVVGRVHPSVARVRLHLDGAEVSTVDLEPAGDPAMFGVRFVGTVLPPATRPVASWALDGSGEPVEREDLGGQAAMLDRPKDRIRGRACLIRRAAVGAPPDLWPTVGCRPHICTGVVHRPRDQPPRLCQGTATLRSSSGGVSLSTLRTGRSSTG